MIQRVSTNHCDGKLVGIGNVC